VVQYLDTIEEVEGRAPPFSHWGRSSTFLAAHPQGSQRLCRIEIDDLAQGRFKRHALWRGVGGFFGSTSVIEMGILNLLAQISARKAVAMSPTSWLDRDSRLTS
jgi:hypothetical protein